MPNRNYAKNIFNARKKKQLTQKEISIILDCPISTISSWENSLFKPSPAYLLKLSELLELTLEELTDETVNEGERGGGERYSSILPTKLTADLSSNQLATLIKGFSLLSERDKHEIIELIKIKIASQHI